MQQKLAQKEKEAKEENIRLLLAQRAREERSGVSQTASSRPTAESRAAAASALGGYGSDSGTASGEDEEEEAAKLRDELRTEKLHEREREMRVSNTGAEQRAKVLA